MFYEAETLFGDKTLVNLDNVDKIEQYNGETRLTFNCFMSEGSDGYMVVASFAIGEYDKIKKYLRGQFP